MIFPRFTVITRLTVKELERHRVDCGTCPVNMACAVSNGGTGWRFPCCGSTAVPVQGATFVLDCNNNTFEDRRPDLKPSQCPMCTGDIVEAAVRGNVNAHVYVPTVHAKVSLKTRLDVWQGRLPKALQKVQEEKLRLKED